MSKSLFDVDSNVTVTICVKCVIKGTKCDPNVKTTNFGFQEPAFKRAQTCRYKHKTLNVNVLFLSNQ